MRIGIIGAGNMGAALAGLLSRAGHRVVIANSRGPETIADVGALTGATPVGISDVASHAEVVIVSVPEKNIPALAAQLSDGLPGSAIVVDTGNYVPALRDGRIDGIEKGLPESLWVQEQLGRPVIKAFNTIRPGSLTTLGQPTGTTGRTAVPVAGDDALAKSVVLRLAEQLGFDGLDAGSLADSWRQQPGTPVYTADLPKEPARQALERAAPDQTARWRSQTPATPRA